MLQAEYAIIMEGMTLLDFVPSPKSNCAQIGCLLLAGPADRPSTHSLVVAFRCSNCLGNSPQLLIAIIHSAAGGCVRGLRIRIKRSFAIPSSSSWFVYFLSMAAALMPLFRSAALLLCAWSALASAVSSRGFSTYLCLSSPLGSAPQMAFVVGLVVAQFVLLRQCLAIPAVVSPATAAVCIISIRNIQMLLQAIMVAQGIEPGRH